MNESITPIDWNAIADVCGYSPEEIEALKKSQEFRLPDDPIKLMKVVYSGVVAERQRRDAETDAPGGLTDEFQ